MLPSAHPETRIFSQFSSFLEMGTELSAFNKLATAEYRPVWPLFDQSVQIQATGVHCMGFPCVILVVFQVGPAD